MTFTMYDVLSPFVSLRVLFFTGFLDDQNYVHLTNNGTIPLPKTNLTPGLERNDRFKLNNLSFAGPVIMGVGGKLL